MRRTQFAQIGLIILVVVSVWSCQRGSEYQRLVKSELGKERQDSLLLDIYLGMSKDSFYNHCFALNRDTIVWQGSQNMSVQYYLDDNELKHKAVMNFYPKFVDEKIVVFPVIINYIGWAPWNEELQPEPLKLDVKNMLMDWYGGNEFLEVEHPVDGTAFVKVDGNRRITIEKNSMSEIVVTYRDMSVDFIEEEEKRVRLF